MAVGKVGFTQYKCEVTVRYCNKIKRRDFCWQGTGTAGKRQGHGYRELCTPKQPTLFCVRAEKLAAKPVNVAVYIPLPASE